MACRTTRLYIRVLSRAEGCPAPQGFTAGQALGPRKRIGACDETCLAEPSDGSGHEGGNLAGISTTSHLAASWRFPRENAVCAARHTARPLATPDLSAVSLP